MIFLGKSENNFDLTFLDFFVTRKNLELIRAKINLINFEKYKYNNTIFFSKKKVYILNKKDYFFVKNLINSLNVSFLKNNNESNNNESNNNELDSNEPFFVEDSFYYFEKKNIINQNIFTAEELQYFKTEIKYLINFELEMKFKENIPRSRSYKRNIQNDME